VWWTTTLPIDDSGQEVTKTIEYCVSNRKARAFVVARHKSLKIYWKTPCDGLRVRSVFVSLGGVCTCRSRYSDWRAYTEEQSRSATACWPPPDRRTSLPPPHRRTPYHSRQRLPVEPSLTAAAPRRPACRRSCAFSLRRTLTHSHHPSHDSPPAQGRRHRTDDNIIIVVCTTYVVPSHVFSRSSPPSTWRSPLPTPVIVIYRHNDNCRYNNINWYFLFFRLSTKQE